MGILRFILALSVVIAHSNSIFGLKLVGGEVAVQSFYIISGFYMAMVLTEKYFHANGSYKVFVTNRLLRLYPIYWFILGLAISLSLVAFFKSPNGSDKINNYITLSNLGIKGYLLMTWAAIANIIFFFQDWFIFLGINTTGSLHFVNDFHTAAFPLYKLNFIPQAWTIGVEISFYLIAPFIVRFNTKYLIALLVGSVSIRTILFFNGLQDDPWTYRFFPSELAFFIIGILTYKVYVKYKNNSYPALKYFESCSLIIILFITVFFQWVDFKIVRFMYPILVALIIPLLFNNYKNSRFDRWIGELSYPIYISHITVLIIIQKFNLNFLQNISLSVIVFATGLSVVLNYVITRPIEKYRQNRIKQILVNN